MNSKVRSNGNNVSRSTGDFESLYLELLKLYYEEGNREQARKVASRLDESLVASSSASRNRGISSIMRSRIAGSMFLFIAASDASSRSQLASGLFLEAGLLTAGV